MAGLLQQQGPEQAPQAPQQGQPQQGQPQPPQAPASPQQNLSAEQMAQVKEGFQLGQQVLYHKQIFDGIMADAQEQPPEQVLGQSIVAVLRKVQDKVGKLDLMVAATLGIALLGDIADVLGQLGLQLDEQQQTTAFEVATQMWLVASNGQYQPDEIESAMAQMGGM